MPGVPGARLRLTMLAAGVVLAVAGPWASPALGGSLCGNGVTEGNEACDDANTVECDGCSASCTLDACGDGVLAGSCEECDDGNTFFGDGCAPDCTCEPDVCGDGIQGCLEECDDGNTVDVDGCEADCTITQIIEVMERTQQECVNAINKKLAGVVKAQNADNATCVKDLAAGKTADCLGHDVKGKVAKAAGKATATNGKKCNDVHEIPEFAYTDPATVNDAGAAEPLEAAHAVLGDAPTVILKSADKDGAKCQAEVMKQLGAVSNRWASEANGAKKRLLRGGPGLPPAVGTSVDLAAGIETAVATSIALDRAEARATARIGTKCSDAQADALFDCNGATTVSQLVACVIAAAEEAACNALERADLLALDCPTVPLLP